MNARRELDASSETEHMTVPVAIELRDSIGTLAVSVLAARENLAVLSYDEMLSKLYDIIDGLHAVYNKQHQ